MNKKKSEKRENFIISAQRTLSQKSADIVTKFVGSWGFIIVSAIFVTLWTATNIYGWINSWDPYPFILLNLFLSILAAIQAPIILMSQNRQNEKDRVRSEYDYSVNRKAEKLIEELKKQVNRIEKKLNK
jgi:uncharacterized membrane protein|tara:strand:+ start:719 stop:1105 length:387 start_codon:yes stop_codon:yes gene_type:complete